MSRRPLLCTSVLLVVLVTAGCSKSSKGPTPGGGSTSTVTAAPTATSSTGPHPSNPPTSVSTTPPTDISSRQLPPVGVGQPAPLANKLFVTVTSIKAQTLAARGPGETSGPGVVVTVEIRNDTKATVDLSGLAINAHYGNGIPATANHVPGEALAGTLAPGQHKSGRYEFRIARGTANTVVIDIEHSSAPNVVIVDATR